MKKKRELDGLERIYNENCSCKNVEDQEFHNFFKLINWNTENLKELNRVQDKWSRAGNT